MNIRYADMLMMNVDILSCISHHECHMQLIFIACHVWVNQQVQERADLYQFLPENHDMIEQYHWLHTNLNCIRHQFTNPYMGSGNWLNLLIWLEHLHKCTCNKTDNEMIPQITFLFPVDIATTKQKSGWYPIRLRSFLGKEKPCHQFYFVA